MTDLVATVRFALSRVTPGPWESEPVYGYPEDVRVYTAKENWHIATVGVQGSKKRTANAALIVGAPTWLAALCDEVERRRTENEMALATCDEYHEAETKLLAERATLRSDLEFARAQLASDAQPATLLFPGPLEAQPAEVHRARELAEWWQAEAARLAAQLASDAQTGGWRAQWAAERVRAERAEALVNGVWQSVDFALDHYERRDRSSPLPENLDGWSPADVVRSLGKQYDEAIIRAERAEAEVARLKDWDRFAVNSDHELVGARIAEWKDRAERAEALLNTPFPCPRCGRPGLLLRHMLPEPGRQWGHVPCLSRTDAEEQSDLRLVDVEVRAERAEAALAEMDSDVPFVEIMARAKRTERAEARAERLRCALSDVLDHVRVNDPAVMESAVRAQDALSEETK